jgi:hypothetical protein
MKKYSKSDKIDAEVRHRLSLGWTYYRGTKHGRLVSPDGSQAVTVPGTPSDRRSPLNFIRDLKRADFYHFHKWS